MHDGASADARPSVQGAGAAAEPFADFKQAILREDWAWAVQAFQAAQTGGGLDAPQDRLLFEIAKVRLADFDLSAARLEPTFIRQADGELAMRRHLISPLLRAERSLEAALILEKLIEAYPHLTDARRNLVSVLAKLGRLDEAIRHMDAAAAAAPDDVSLQAGRIQFRLLARQTEAAAQLALDLKLRLPPESRDAHILLTALLRGGYVSAAAEIAAKIDPTKFPTSQVAASATQALLMAGMTSRAISAGEAAVAAGMDSGPLRGHIGEAIMLGARPQDVSSRAVEHLRIGLTKAPEDKRINALYGEALLRSNRHEEAVAFLEKATAVEIKSPKTRSLYARALRAVGRYAEAADQYLQVLDRKTDDWAAHRQAVGVLSQAGRGEDASKVFNAMIAKRSSALPDSFQTALADLDARIDETKIPQARLDWAWSLRLNQDADRAQWERRARWGMLADLLIIDWLECREEQAEQAMSLMASLERADEVFAPMRAAGKGFVIATAHLGPLFSGPILLELCGLPSRWVASTPSIADAHYAASVISTSDKTETQVAKACLKSLQMGYAVGIAIDGSGRMGSPTIPFEGQEITYSSFAARAAHRAKVPSLFYAARWEDGRIAYTFEHLPSPEPSEEVGPFETRWRHAYLSHLRLHLGGPPENLRMAGGLWSCIRPMA